MFSNLDASKITLKQVDAVLVGLRLLLESAIKVT